jgi:hypothetical protein
LILFIYFIYLINEIYNIQNIDKLGFIVSWILATPLIILRSQYHGLDDIGYSDQYNAITTRNFLDIYENYFWEFSIKIIDILFHDINTIYFIILILFIIKIYIIYVNSNNKIPALLAYLIIFFPMHELTQFRICAATTFLLIGIHFAFRRKIFLSLTNYTITGFFHQAVFFTPLLALYSFVKFSPKIYKKIILAFTVMVLGGLVLSVKDLQNLYLFLRSNTENLPTYLFDESWHPKDYSSTFPLSLIPLTIYLVFNHLYGDVYKEKILYMSFTIGYFLFWLFASVYVIGGRYQEYFLVPLVILIGITKNTFLNKILFNILILSFFIKYNLLSSFFIEK